MLFLLLACDGGNLAEVREVTWHADVRPIVERSCLDCHVEGGLAPIDLSWDPADWADGAPGWAGAVVAAVEAQRMPPWPASTDCQPIAHSRALAAEERALFGAWEEGGFLPGDPLDFEPLGSDPRPEPAGEPSLSLGFQAPYQPLSLLPDDYRCMIVGEPFAAETWVTASRIVPGEPALVHHAIAYLLDPAGAAEALAAADEDGGYTCFGGPLASTGSAATFAGYVPGQASEVLQPGDARPIPPGSLLVLQMHYNTLTAPDPLPADDTRLELWTRPDPPARVVLTTSLSDPDFVIPAGDPDFSTSVEVRFGVAADVISTLGHMHTRGTALTIEAVHPDGSTSCVLDVPRWDFDWQLRYSYEQPFQLGAADAVRLTCRWDNSAAHQPVVNGEQLPPQDVRWGEGTTDEMCIAYADYAIPWASTQGCEPILDCHGSACAEGDGDCLVACWERSLSACGLCVADGILDCGYDSCQGPGAGLLQCAEVSCPGLDTVTCLRGPCSGALADYLACQDEHVRAGECDGHLEVCEVGFGG